MQEDKASPVEEKNADSSSACLTLECQICTNAFASNGPQVPKFIISCGHTCCQSCLRQATKKKMECPFCRKHIPQDIDTLPTNFAVLPPDTAAAAAISKKRRAAAISELTSQELLGYVERKRAKEEAHKSLQLQEQEAVKDRNGAVLKLYRAKKELEFQIEAKLAQVRAEASKMRAAAEPELESLRENVARAESTLGVARDYLKCFKQSI